MRERVTAWSSHRYLPLALGLLAMVLCLPCLWTGLQGDDFLQREILLGTSLGAKYFPSPLSMFHFLDGNPERTRKLMDIGLLPWWTLENVRIAFHRPLAVLTHWLDYRLWPDHIALMHLHSLVWLGGVVAVVTLLYRRVIGVGWVAAVAGLLYAVDEAHAMPAAWLAARNGLVAAFFGVLALLAHDRWRRDGMPAAAFAAPTCVLLGVLSNEGGIASCAYLFAYAVFVDRGRWRVRALSLVPCGVVVVVWRFAYSSMGYGTWGSNAYRDPLQSPLLFLDSLRHRAPALLLGQWALPSSVVSFLVPTVRWVLWVAGLVFFLWLLAVLIPLLRRDRAARFWCLGMVLALVPSCAGGASDRLLLFVGVGAMGLLAQFIHAVRTGVASRSLPSVWRAFARPLYYAFIIVHLVLAPVLLPLTIYVSTGVGNRINAAIDTAPLDDRAVDQTVILVNSPNPLLATYLPSIRALKGKPVPARVRSLAPNRGRQPIRFTRTDERSLLMKPERGFSWSLFRDVNHPLAVGDRVELAGMSAEVMTLTEQGLPLEVAYRFDVPLEDPSLVWLELRDYAFVRLAPPSVGESIELNR